MNRLFIFAGKRLLFVPVAVLLVVTLSFALVTLVPSDPALEIAGDLATEEQLQEIRSRLGLTDPIPERYVDYLNGLAHGDLGKSFYSGRPVIDDIKTFLPHTLELVIPSILLAVALGAAWGAFGAYFKGRVPDKVARVFISIVQSVPDFLLSLLLIYLVFFLLRWAPAPVGRLDLFDSVPESRTGFLFLDSVISGEWGVFRSAVLHSMLPILTLGIIYSAYFAKTARSALASAFGSYQVEFARACGLPERKVLAYAFRQAGTPLMTYAGILFAGLAGGAAIVETVFAWGGLGQWAIRAILKLDIPAIQGFILTVALLTLLIFLLLDLLVVLFDPRISYGR